mmetsp:Transcript_25322/g.71440  ORF Transcript_25322/g.71440 Transcript_25322/m.71440 type:complete len:254 (-) Transcript_25322:31-792(-)
MHHVRGRHPPAAGWGGRSGAVRRQLSFPSGGPGLPRGRPRALRRPDPRARPRAAGADRYLRTHQHLRADRHVRAGDPPQPGGRDCHRGACRGKQEDGGAVPAGPRAEAPVVRGGQERGGVGVHDRHADAEQQVHRAHRGVLVGRHTRGRQRGAFRGNEQPQERGPELSGSRHGENNTTPDHSTSPHAPANRPGLGAHEQLHGQLQHPETAGQRAGRRGRGWHLQGGAARRRERDRLQLVADEEAAGQRADHRG